MSARLEALVLQMGRPGRYQMLIFAILQFQYVFFAACFISLSFWSIVPPLACSTSKPENILNSTTTHAEKPKCPSDTNPFSTDQGLNVSTELKTLHGHRLCEEVQFTSIAMEWGFVCEKQYTVPILQTLFFCGAMLGGMICGPLADRFGRKPIAFSTLFVAASLGVVITFISNFYVFAVCKLLQGILLQGYNSASNCMKTEILHGKYRARVIAIGDALGMSLPMFYLAISAHLTSNWRYVELGMSVPLLLTIGCIWVVPESFRWLLKTKKREEGLRVIKRFTKFNGLPLPTNIDQEIDVIIQEINEESQTRHDLRDLFKTPRLALYSCIFSFSWFTWLLLNYGIMFSMAHLSGNLFINFVILGLVDLIFRCIAYFLLLRLEGKQVTCLGLSTTGVLLLGVAIINSAIGKTYASGIAATAFAMLGRAFIGFFVVATYINISEVFPTPLRATAYGLFAATGRAGALLSSQVIALGDISWRELPFVIFSACGFLAGIGNLLLPKTRNKPMPNTIHETLSLHKISSLLIVPSVPGLAGDKQCLSGGPLGRPTAYVPPLTRVVPGPDDLSCEDLGALQYKSKADVLEAAIN